jgi:hypothetical protein
MDYQTFLESRRKSYEKMAVLRSEGKTLQQIADKFRISKQRVSVIISKYFANRPG